MLTQDAVDTVRVTNRNNAWHVRDKYAAVEYFIRAGESLTMPREAAEHIFGYGLSEQERFKKFMRMGIANHPDGKKMWDRITIRPVGGNIEATGTVREAA